MRQPNDNTGSEAAAMNADADSSAAQQQQDAATTASAGASPVESGPHDRVDGGGADGRADLNLDDEEIMSGSAGRNARTGGTANAIGGDSGRIAPPAEMLSDRNGPSAPD